MTLSYFYSLHKKHTHKTSGFTLVESLIYFAILGILLVAIGSILFHVILGKIKAETIQEVSQNARIVTERIADSVRNAQSISTPSSGQTTTSLSLTMTAASKNPTVFDVSSGRLRIKEGSSAAQNITGEDVTVSSISFTNVSYANTPGTVRIALTLAASGTSVLKEYKYQNTFYTTVTIRPR
jgi:type II secretory pathway pseudopilin PulG